MVSTGSSLIFTLWVRCKEPPLDLLSKGSCCTLLEQEPDPTLQPSSSNREPNLNACSRAGARSAIVLSTPATRPCLMTLQNRLSSTQTQSGSPAADAKAVWLYFSPVIPELRTLPREGERKRRGRLCSKSHRAHVRLSWARLNAQVCCRDGTWMWKPGLQLAAFVGLWWPL